MTTEVSRGIRAALTDEFRERVKQAAHDVFVAANPENVHPEVVPIAEITVDGGTRYEVIIRKSKPA